MLESSSSFYELWSAWGPLIATIFGFLTALVVYLAKKLERVEGEERKMTDEFMQKYISLLKESIMVNSANAETLKDLSDTIKEIEMTLRMTRKD